MTTESSIFTKIIAGDIPGYIPYQDDTVAVLIALEGHVLVVPKVVYPDIFTIPEDIAAHLMKIAVRTAIALKNITHCDGVNLIQSNGSAAGQEVFHFHLHIKPRYANDSMSLSWDTDIRPAAERSQLADALATHLI